MPDCYYLAGCRWLLGCDAEDKCIGRDVEPNADLGPLGSVIAANTARINAFVDEEGKQADV